MKPITYFIIFFIFIFSTVCFSSTKKPFKKKDPKTRVLVIDGQSVNHKHWKQYTPVLLKQLSDSELFLVDVYTSPLKGEKMDDFNPKFDDYDVIVSLYDGEAWPAKVQKSFDKYISKGGGLVVIHAADNSFPQWDAYNEMIGLGGWGGRNESNGPYVYINADGETIKDTSEGKGGHHGKKHEFQMTGRNLDHPIMRDLPQYWMHTKDELYEQLRGPAKNMDILATAFSSPDYGGSGRNEPMLIAITYGDGKIFHTALGHDRIALSCVGFMTTFVRGCQWAAGTDVTFAVPQDFPEAETPSSRVY